MKKNPKRIQFTVSEAFKNRTKLLAAKWGVKTNVAIQRAVDLAFSRESPGEEKALLKTVAAQTEKILELVLPE